MKKTKLFILTLFSVALYASVTSFAQNTNNIRPTYNYIDVELNADDLVTNLERNWFSYANRMGWSAAKRDAVYSCYKQYREAIKQGRLYSDANHAVWDKKGELSNGDITYWDASGKPLSVTLKDKGNHKKSIVVLNDIENTKYNPTARTDAYHNAKKRETKGSTSLYVNREVATFIDLVAGKMYDQYLDAWNKEDEAIKAAGEKTVR